MARGRPRREGGHRGSPTGLRRQLSTNVQPQHPWPDPSQGDGPEAACRTVDATTSVRQVLVVGTPVPTPPWSTTCPPSAVAQRIRCARDGDAHGCPPETAACWDSSPATTRGRSDTYRSSPACLVPGGCPT